MDADYHGLRLRLAEELLLPAARNGELWAIQNLLLIVSDAIGDQCVLPEGVAGYLSKALAAIHGGKKADDAFGIRRKRGEKYTRKFRQRRYFMADCVERLRYHEKLTLESATEVVAERFSMTPDSVKLAWKENHKEVKRIHALEKECFGRVDDVVWPG
jgi:hypothetical protein